MLKQFFVKLSTELPSDVSGEMLFSVGEGRFSSKRRRTKIAGAPLDYHLLLL